MTLSGIIYIKTGKSPDRVPNQGLFGDFKNRPLTNTRENELVS
jgi:hypothetical protein